jgi:hypothetical protein
MDWDQYYKDTQRFRNAYSDFRRTESSTLSSQYDLWDISARRSSIALQIANVKRPEYRAVTRIGIVDTPSTQKIYPKQLSKLSPFESNYTIDPTAGTTSLFMDQWHNGLGLPTRDDDEAIEGFRMIKKSQFLDNQTAILESKAPELRYLKGNKILEMCKDLFNFAMSETSGDRLLEKSKSIFSELSRHISFLFPQSLRAIYEELDKITNEKQSGRLDVRLFNLLPGTQKAKRDILSRLLDPRTSKGRSFTFPNFPETTREKDKTINRTSTGDEPFVKAGPGATANIANAAEMARRKGQPANVQDQMNQIRRDAAAAVAARQGINAAQEEEDFMVVGDGRGRGRGGAPPLPSLSSSNAVTAQSEVAAITQDRMRRSIPIDNDPNLDRINLIKSFSSSPTTVTKIMDVIESVRQCKSLVNTILAKRPKELRDKDATYEVVTKMAEDKIKSVPDTTKTSLSDDQKITLQQYNASLMNKGVVPPTPPPAAQAPTLQNAAQVGQQVAQQNNAAATRTTGTALAAVQPGQQIAPTNQPGVFNANTNTQGQMVAAQTADQNVLAAQTGTNPAQPEMNQVDIDAENMLARDRWDTEGLTDEDKDKMAANFRITRDQVDELLASSENGATVKQFDQMLKQFMNSGKKVTEAQMDTEGQMDIGEDNQGTQGQDEISPIKPLRDQNGNVFGLDANKNTATQSAATQILQNTNDGVKQNPTETQGLNPVKTKEQQDDEDLMAFINKLPNPDQPPGTSGPPATSPTKVPSSVGPTPPTGNTPPTTRQPSNAAKPPSPATSSSAADASSVTMSEVGTVGTVGPVTTISDVALNMEQLTLPKAKEFLEGSMEIKTEAFNKWIVNNTIEGDIPSLILKTKNSSPLEISNALNKVATEKREFLIPIYKSALQMLLFQPFRDACYKIFDAFGQKLGSDPVQLDAFNKAVFQIGNQNTEKMKNVIGILTSFENKNPTFKSPLKRTSVQQTPAKDGPTARLEFGEVPAAPAPSPPKPSATVPAAPSTPANDQKEDETFFTPKTPKTSSKPLSPAQIAAQKVPTDVTKILPAGSEDRKIRVEDPAANDRIYSLERYTFYDQLVDDNAVSRAVKDYISKGDSAKLDILNFGSKSKQSLTYMKNKNVAKEALDKLKAAGLFEVDGSPKKSNSQAITLLTTEFGKERISKQNGKLYAGGGKRARSVSFVKGYESKKQKRQGRMEGC